MKIQEEIKKEDKKSFGKFIVTMLVCGLGGAVFGFIIGFAPDNIFTIIRDNFVGTMMMVSPYIGFVLTVIVAAVIAILYKQSRKLYANWDGEDERVINTIGKKLSYSMLISNINVILYYIFMAISFAKDNETASRTEVMMSLGIFIVSFVFVLAVSLYSQQKIVNFEKEINPGKKGSIYDSKFMKKWEDSCDEAEKLMIYKAAYASFKTVNYVCIALWLFCVIAILIWETGIMPVCMVGIIWMASSVSYTLKAMELECKSNM